MSRVPIPDDGVVHEVQQGENLESIAYRYGHCAETLWSHERNGALGEQRKDRNVLLPGDAVYVPPRRAGGRPAATGALHRFRLRGVPSMLRFRALFAMRPLADQPYVLEVDGAEVARGRTDANGGIERYVAPDARAATLHVGTEPFVVVFHLALRALDPADTVTGAQGRLSNLRYYAGELHGTLDEATELALRAFQFEHGLEVTGTLDAATAARLREAHGS